MFKSVIKYGLSEGLSRLVPFLLTLYIAKNMTVTSFGTYSLVIILYEIIFIAISFNIQATTRIDYYKESYSTFISIKKNHIVISTLHMIIITLIIYIIYTNYYVILLLVLASYFRTISTLILAILQCQKRVNEYFIINIVYILTFSLLLMYFINLGFDYYSWIYGIIVASFIQSMLSCYIIGIKVCSHVLNSKYEKNQLKKTYWSALMFLPQAVGWWLKNGIDRIIISDKLGNEVLGQYSLAFQIASVIIISVAAINLWMIPELNEKLNKSDIDGADKTLAIAVLMTLAVAVVAPFVANYFLIPIFGADYKAALNYIYFLSIAVFLQSLLMIVVNVLYFYGHKTYVAILIIIMFSIQGFISYYIVNYYGVKGIIIISIIVNLITLTIVLIKKHIILKKTLM